MQFNLAAHVLAQTAARADHPALEVLGRAPMTYATLAQAVRGTATGLLQTGLRPGDRVLMRLGNTVDFPIAYLAAITVDLIPVPTSAQLTRPEVASIIATTAPAAILHDGETALPATTAPVLGLADLQAMRSLPPAEFALGDPDRPGYIIFTSGTSGQPRAVVHAHRAILARKMMWDGWYGLTADDRLLHAGAFNWTYTLGTGLLDPWSVGATALIPPPGTDPADLSTLLARSGATIFAAAPGVYRRMLRAPLPPLPALRHGLSAGEKMPTDTRAAWQTATGTAVHEAFGMTECSTFISGSPARPAPADALGYAQPGRRVQLMPDGQIAVHRSDPGLMLGYLDAPDETAARFDGDWFLTGDIASQTAEGAFVYQGRTDDMMNAGGTRVSPIEVETALSAHPRITEVAAAEVRLRTDLSLIAAFYVAPDMIDDRELTDFAASRLATYKVPRVFCRVPHLPRGSNNKLLRSVLRKDWERQNGQA